MRRRHKTQGADFVSHRESQQGRGYEPLQLELAKKSKSKGRKSKRCKWMYIAYCLSVKIPFTAEDYVEL